MDRRKARIVGLERVRGDCGHPLDDIAGGSREAIARRGAGRGVWGPGLIGGYGTGWEPVPSEAEETRSGPD
jgi:hypothetical protein